MALAPDSQAATTEPRPPASADDATAPATAARQLRQGLALVRQGWLDEAAQAIAGAAHAEPDAAITWAHLAGVQRRLRQDQQAIASARRAFALDPAERPICHQLVELLRLDNRPAEALAVLRALDPATERDLTHAMLEGALLMALGQPQPAAQAFLQALTIQPAHAEAYMQLGLALASLRCHRQAAECLRTVAMIDPSQLGAAVYAPHYAAWACDWQQQQQDEQRLAAAWQRLDAVAPAAVDAAAAVPSLSPFCLLALADDPLLQRRAARLESARLAREIRQRTGWQPGDPGPAGYPLAAQALAGGRCRVGFVASDFRNHATSVLMVRILERLDRHRFELFLYSHGEDDRSALRRRCEDAADHFVDCRETSLPAQAQRIRDDGIVLLVDLGGYTARSRLQLFALRPAPVQLSWLAYPGTTGADFIDYLVGDPVITPVAHAGDFDERLAQLPLCYQPTDELRPHPPTTLCRGDVCLPADGFVFASFNQSYKLTEPVFARWCAILLRVPDSVLWLLVEADATAEALRGHARARGIDPGRLVFAPFVDNAEHLARIPLADLFVDTFPCGAHTTCTDALWMGLPVLTRIGRSLASRVAASLLGAVGLPELVVETAEAYEDLAVRLAEDHAALAALRDHLRANRRALPLFDSAGFTRALATLFGRMAARWQAGLAPAMLTAE